MGLKIIGAGFGRTGTKSMKEALEHLGFGPCYHMFEVFQNPGHIPVWHDAAFGKEVDWPDLFSGYQSGVDWPIAHFWEPVSRVFPDAKILLTVRPASDWYTSMTNTIFSHVAGYQPKDESGRVWKVMVDKIVRTDTFDNRTGDRAYCESVFERHIADVKAKVPPHQLIVYEVGSGWAPLCEALGVDVPDIPFPKTNTTAEFQAR